MTWVVVREPSDPIKGIKAMKPRALGYFVAEVAAGTAGKGRSDAKGILESNLTPSDELWNNSHALSALVRRSGSEPDLLPMDNGAMQQVELPTTAGGRSAATRVESIVKRAQPPDIRASIPIGIWQGEITTVDRNNGTFSADLTPLRGSDMQISGDLSFDQVNPEDHTLIEPGSIFYLEQFSRMVRRQVSTDQCIRFRRSPAWTKEQVQRVTQRSAELAGAMLEGLARMKLAD